MEEILSGFDQDIPIPASEKFCTRLSVKPNLGKFDTRERIRSTEPLFGLIQQQPEYQCKLAHTTGQLHWCCVACAFCIMFEVFIICIKRIHRK